MHDVLLQVAQVLAVVLLAPLLQGFILRYEERVQRARGPSLFQPYRDLLKLFRKQQVVPETASFVFFVAPVIAFTCMLVVPILIPVLTNFPLPLSDMGDILGGGLILTLGGFMVTLAGLDSGSAYGGIGSSRSVMLAILAEPALILVFVGIALLAKAMLPFVVNHLLVTDSAIYWGPAHLFLTAAFFILLLVETDRLPIHSSTHIEVYMIEEARILEYSGPLLALLPLALWRFAPRRQLRRAPVWYGGLPRSSERVATSALAFSNALRTFYSFIYRPTLDVEHEHPAEQKYFVRRLRFNHKVAPVFGPRLFAPLVDGVRTAAARIARLQSGHLNAYVAIIGLILALILLLPVLS
ncbi:MAG: NADH-quinone oxidoreductase subunit H [Gammaproteobacteria bacterium]|nr:NADH-quinone oxidoreductase subunit H [Gammaproteobacteria bacterium]